jgi:hypothetical protein
MGVRERLWYYCPRPLKRRSHFLEGVATSLRIPNLKNIRTPHMFSVLSLSVSLILFYVGMFLSICLLTGTTTGVGVLLGNAMLLLLSILFFSLLWAGVDSFLSVMRKKGVKALLATILLLIVVPSAIAGSVEIGVFDSVTLQDGSTIDLHNCRTSLSITNNGVKEITITKIEVGDILTSRVQNSLARDESRVFTIDYSDPIVFHEFFKEGTYYPVVIHTEGLLTYSFKIQAKYSKRDRVDGVHAQLLSLTERTIDGHDTYIPSINVTFDISGFMDPLIVYSVNIGLLTLRLNPPSAIWRIPIYSSSNYLYQLGIYYVDGNYRADVPLPSMLANVIPSQSPETVIFKLGETYSLTIRTMENNLYTTSITITK